MVRIKRCKANNTRKENKERSALRRRNKKMKIKMNAKEIEQVNGGTLIDDMKEILKKIFPDPKDRMKLIILKTPEPVVARIKC